MTGGILIVLIFLLMLSLMTGLNWYKRKYKSNINFTAVIAGVFIALCLGFFLMVKKMGAGEKQDIIENVAVENVVTQIITDTHKAYFKDIKLDNGKILPMPEAMNGLINIGDSIYKKKADLFYTVIYKKDGSAQKFNVTVHERVLSKPQ